jgi:hypothetical protein
MIRFIVLLILAETIALTLIGVIVLFGAALFQ